MNELPEGWVETTLGDVIEGFESGRNLNANGVPAVDNEFGVIKISAVTWGEFRPKENKALFPGDQPKDHEIIRQGDVLISRANTTELVGAVVQVDRDHPRLMLPDKILRIKFRRDAILGAFLVRGLRTAAAKKHFMEQASGTSDSMRNLSQPKLSATPLLVPPLDEQKRIVAKIDALTEKSRQAREALDDVPNLLDKLRQSILAAAFRGDLTKAWREKNPNVEPASKLLERIRTERRKRWEEAELTRMQSKGKVPKDDSWKQKYEEPEPVDTDGLPELPEGWCWARWKEVGDSQNGRPFPSGEYQAHGVKLLRPGNLSVSGWVEWTDANTRCMPAEYEGKNSDHVIGPGELVMNLTAQSLKDQFLGRVCLTRDGEHCLLNQRLARLSPILLPVDYVFFWMKSPVFRRFVDDLNTGTLIQHMFTSQVDQHLLPIAPYAEQLQVVRELRRMQATHEPIAAACSHGEQSLSQFDSSILAKAFRGELVPQDPNDEPASVLLARIRSELETAAMPEKRSKRRNA